MKQSVRIYLDHQATCPLDERVFAAMREHLAGPAANPHSSEHSFGWQAAKAVFEAQEQVATMIGAEADEVIFTSGASEANNLALFGRDYGMRPKVIVTPIEHKCVLEAARALEVERGVELAIVEVDEAGVVCLDHLEQLVDERTAVVAIIGVHNEIGTIQPLAKISNIARRSGARLHLDLAQAPLAIDLSGAAEWADTISLSAHKMYGPMGVGCLYVARDEQPNLKPQILGGGQQNGLRSGTIPVALVAGMAKAAEIVMKSPRERDQLHLLNGMLWEHLQMLPCAIELNGPSLEFRHPGNLNVSILGYDGRDIIAAIQPEVAISSGSACTSGTEEASYVLQSVGHSADRARSALRLSVGRSTTEAELITVVELIESALKRFEVAA